MEESVSRRMHEVHSSHLLFDVERKIFSRVGDN